MTETAGESPLPPSHAALLRLDGPGNRSLLYDRGFDRYEIEDGGAKVVKEGKPHFLAEFRRKFLEPGGFDQFLDRRRKAIEGPEPESQPERRPEVKTVELYTQTRLVTGLGLPSPTETGLLLDRLTGCPYLPGSSVKGLLRHAAKLVAQGELETAKENDDASYWQEHRAAVFGPDRTEAETPAKGQVLFFDAFPTAWPNLELDVLTPHYSAYYGDESGTEPPADWHDPVPVAFLTVAPGTRFRFHFVDGARTPAAEGTGILTAPDPLPRLERLLETALDWLGIGGKTSSGYGLFGKVAPPRPAPAGQQAPRQHEAGQQPGGPRHREPPSPKESLATTPGETLWKNVELSYWQGRPTVHRNPKTAASCDTDKLDPKLLKRIKKGKTVRVDARVVQSLGGWRVEAIETVHE